MRVGRGAALRPLRWPRSPGPPHSCRVWRRSGLLIPGVRHHKTAALSLGAHPPRRLARYSSNPQADAAQGPGRPRSSSPTRPSAPPDNYPADFNADEGAAAAPPPAFADPINRSAAAPVRHAGTRLDLPCRHLAQAPRLPERLRPLDRPAPRTLGDALLLQRPDRASSFRRRRTPAEAPGAHPA